MALPTPDQLVPRAIARERLPATPTPGSVEAIAKAVDQRVNQGEWRAGLELGKKPSLDRKNTSEKIEGIGVNRDPTTGAKQRTPEEQARYDRAKNGEALAFKVLDKGYDQMSPTEQNRLAAAVLAEAKLRPALAAELNAMNPLEQTRWVLRRLRDPRYAAEIGKALERHGDPENRLGNEVLQVQEKVEEQETERQNKQLEIDDVDRRLARVNAQLAEFARPGGGMLPGAKAVEIDRIKTSLATIQAELVTYKTQVDDVQFRLTQLQQERQAALRAGYTGRPLAEIDTEVGAERGNLKTAQKEAEKREADLQRLPALENEEQQLEQQRQTLDKEKRERQAETNKIELELRKRQREFADAQALRASREEDIAKGFENVFTEATNEVLNQEVQQYVDAANAEIEELKQKATDQNEKAMYDALQQRWLGGEKERGFFRRERYRPINRAMVDADYNVLLAQGPEEVMRQLLMSRINPTTGATYTLAEVNEIIANKDYATKMQPEVVKQLLAKRILSGGIAQEDAQIIVTSQWGRGMIEEALKVRTELRTALEGLMGAGALGGPGFWRRLAGEINRHPLWLLALLGLVVVPFAGLPSIVGFGGIGVTGAGVSGAALRAAPQIQQDLSI